MKRIIPLLLSVSIWLQNLHAQKLFQKVDLQGNAGAIGGIAQDKLGYIWIALDTRGLLKYDGNKFIVYTHSDKDSNSLASTNLATLIVDSSGNIWIATKGAGLDMFDPSTNSFNHFRHNAKDPNSISHDTVDALLQDHYGDIWVGTNHGLDRYDAQSGKFIHFVHKDNDLNSLSGVHVRVIYEDREGRLWVGCGSPFPNEEAWKGEGGLNLFDRKTGKFTRFLHDPNDSSSIANNKVRALLEDSKGNFWVGTAGDGLQTLNRQTGKFTHYYYNSTHPEKLSRGPLYKGLAYDQVTFIKEDIKGRIWIGTFAEGIVEYDPITKEITHYGYIHQPGKIIRADTASGYNVNQGWCAMVSKSGLLWIGTLTSSLYKIDSTENVALPYTYLNDHPGGNSFYEENDSTLWIATLGLIRRNTKTGKEIIYLNHYRSTPGANNIECIAKDNAGYLWVGTGTGVDKFDPVKEKFIPRKAADSTGLYRDNIFYMLMDHEQHLWVGTTDGLYRVNTQTGKALHFRHDPADSNSLVDYQVLCIAESSANIWAATMKGLDRITKSNGAVKHFLKEGSVKAVFKDRAGVVWAGTTDGIYFFNAQEKDFVPFNNINVTINGVLGINGDSHDNLWIAGTGAIFKIDSSRKNVTVYTDANGVHPNTFYFCDNIVTKKDEILIGDQSGYYHFFSKDADVKPAAPYVNITSFMIGNKEITPESGGILSKPLYQTNTIKLSHDQNSFAIGFCAIIFRSKNNERYLYKMENYDNTWHDLNANSEAFFFSLPPGKYIFRARAVNEDGGWAEKDLSVIIFAPWWQTWWGISILFAGLIAIILGFSYYRSYSLRKENKILEEKVKHRTEQLQQSLENLKSTQSQLVQQEKMASLGELTAGIAHEIQNPLNFVNNFSEVNKEMLDELRSEQSKPAEQRDMGLEEAILKDVIANEEKIIHHGKRADSIVKSMLQHSRQTSGAKEPQDINALCDEYLRLSYHGMRARDKSFEADFTTDFDSSIGKINIVPQDIGRVLLNLFNNAFYAVNEQKKRNFVSYEPRVSVITKKNGDSATITVTDNGSGIPLSIKEKIFQPFFTTKPAGSGTGLGLSLSYDIVKAHDGELKVETKEGEGTQFVILLPIGFPFSI